MSFHVLMSRYPRSFCRKSLWREAKGILPSSPFISGHLHRKSLVLTPPTWPGRDPSRCHCGRIRESPGRRSFATELLCCAPCACAMKSGTAGREIQRIRGRGTEGLIISAWMKKKMVCALPFDPCDTESCRRPRRAEWATDRSAPLNWR